MGNNIKPIPSKAREYLEAITDEFGIEVIEEYIKSYKKRQRRRMRKNNTKEEVAYDVYKLIFKEKYNRTRAIEKIALERNIKENTINNHLNNFNKEAKENNFYTIGWIADKIYDYTYYDYTNLEKNLNLLVKANELEMNILDTYYWKYKTLPKKEKIKYKVSLSNVKIPNDLKYNILKEYFPEYNEINKKNNTQTNEDEIPF